jgi:hypothetical protein
VVSLCREFEREGRLIADWCLLGTQPLGMAPCKLLGDADMMRGQRMGENTNADQWHAGPAREMVGASESCLVPSSL